MLDVPYVMMMIMVVVVSNRVHTTYGTLFFSNREGVRLTFMRKSLGIANKTRTTLLRG